MKDLAGMRLEDALNILSGKYEVSLIEIASPKMKYGNKRVVRQRIITGKSMERIEITYAGFPVLEDKLV